MNFSALKNIHLRRHRRDSSQKKHAQRKNHPHEGRRIRLRRHSEEAERMNFSALKNILLRRHRRDSSQKKHAQRKNHPHEGRRIRLRRHSEEAERMNFSALKNILLHDDLRPRTQHASARRERTTAPPPSGLPIDNVRSARRSTRGSQWKRWLPEPCAYQP